MRMNKKVYILCFLSIILICATGCGDSWIKPKIISPIDGYSPTMSSVPGFPLKVEFDIDGPMTNISAIKFIANKGSFLVVGEDMKVINLGKIAELSGKPLYWTPLGEDNEMVKRAKITAIVSYFDKYVEVAKSTSVRIYKNKDGMYTFR